MPDESRGVEQIVIETLEALSGMERKQIHGSDELLHDLHITGDDLSFVFVPEVERALGVKTDPSVWNNVSTVRDAIDVFASTLRSGG